MMTIFIYSMQHIQMVQMLFVVITVIGIVIQVREYIYLINEHQMCFVYLVKSVNFYGRNSEYVISGSDCGNVFIWDKTSEKCIWYDKGDDDGTVNVLEPHPHFPIIATSGLEHDIKIWSPLSQESVDFKRLKTVKKKIWKIKFDFFKNR
jgi:WD40 repeat protein